MHEKTPPLPFRLLPSLIRPQDKSFGHCLKYLCITYNLIKRQNHIFRLLQYGRHQFTHRTPGSIGVTTRTKWLQERQSHLLSGKQLLFCWIFTVYVFIATLVMNIRCAFSFLSVNSNHCSLFVTNNHLPNIYNCNLFSAYHN